MWPTLLLPSVLRLYAISLRALAPRDSWPLYQTPSCFLEGLLCCCVILSVHWLIAITSRASMLGHLLLCACDRVGSSVLQDIWPSHLTLTTWPCHITWALVNVNTFFCHPYLLWCDWKGQRCTIQTAKQAQLHLCLGIERLCSLSFPKI